MNNNILLIQPSGFFDQLEGDKLCTAISSLPQNDIHLCLIDFQNVTFINSSGLGALVATLKTIHSAGGEMFLCSFNSQIKIIFELTKMDTIFNIFADRDEFNGAILFTN